MTTLSCEAFLFDLDGTLIDSIAVVDRSWTRWAVRHGRDPAEVLPHIHGRRSIDSLSVLAPHLDIEAEDMWIRSLEAGDTEGVVPLPGALEFVSAIPIDRWSIVTSGTSDVATARMGAVGLNPKVAVYGEDVPRGKPFPDPYLMGAEMLGRRPEECLVFEDTAAGVKSGLAAGMQVIAVTSGADRPDLSIATCVIGDYRQLRIRIAEDKFFIEAE